MAFFVVLLHYFRVYLGGTERERGREREREKETQGRVPADFIIQN
jgi:hypothetical protein